MFCDEVSIEHHDGTTECLDPTCTIDHGAHQWHARCDALVGGCRCRSERPAPLAQAELAQAA